MNPGLPLAELFMHDDRERFSQSNDDADSHTAPRASIMLGEQLVDVLGGSTIVLGEYVTSMKDKLKQLAGFVALASTLSCSSVQPVVDSVDDAAPIVCSSIALAVDDHFVGEVCEDVAPIVQKILERLTRGNRALVSSPGFATIKRGDREIGYLSAEYASDVQRLLDAEEAE